ncbi:carbohydrate esterase family 3 protein [Annulohypoxylon truncatum]|uniref:carbohydrate esterase family 3 protein n=1 Tax=Annulohypoxylon truncatum TaxID=327061 RepID=UPI0020073EBB|nr:carbohydrate esterase family 3 protein [Annulohypoxylon truncatum]KAI1207301.1 carbohydrate esterase family 3 protein [Annulohypoxylon truncatum]
MEQGRSEKSAEPPKVSRLGIIRSKKAIAAFIAFACLLVATVILVALAATGTIGANDASDEFVTEKELASDVSMPGPGSTPTSDASESTSSASAKPSVTPSVVNSVANPHGIPLRIMALGASIVKGETSPGYLGFRKPMRDELVDLGFTVNMVGSVRLGDFIDNDVEAYGGKKILEMLEYAKEAVPKTLPNLFVINLGTNNLLQNKDVDKVGQQMKELIDYLLTASSKSTVVMSTMLTNKVPDKEPIVLDMNKQYRDMMKDFDAHQKPVVLAEMHPSEGGSEVPTVDDIGPDGSHPTVEGYEMMARIFVKAIQEAEEKGFLRKAVDNGIPEDGDAERTG